jgi:hypothetical protein
MRTWSMRAGVYLLSWAGMVGCGSGTPAQGSERGACFPNNTCNAGLVCLSAVCVNANGDANPGSDAESVDATRDDAGANLDVTPRADVPDVDAQRRTDAGLLCPGADIFHPGTETRNVGVSVAFAGRGRNADCDPITGGSLVWTDSLEGQIGTGENFNYTFTQTGQHTVTLTARDSSNVNYTASVTFTIQ